MLEVNWRLLGYQYVTTRAARAAWDVSLAVYLSALALHPRVDVASKQVAIVEKPRILIKDVRDIIMFIVNVI